MIISIIISVIAIISYISSKVENDENAVIKSMLKVVKISGVSSIIGILGTVFIPTTKEALMIWGVGGTIDYIKENPTAKQIPDKCINALDKWVDSWIEENDSIKNKKEK